MELINLSTNDNVVHCPYNSTHTMPHKTLVLHLTKCPDKPKSSSISFKKCAYNTLHVVHEHELEAHEENCLDRIQLDKVLYSSENSQRPNTIIEKEPTILNEESWDEPEETVNVCKKISERTNFMKPVYGLSKSKRKQLRAQLHTQYPTVDLSYRADLSMNNRQDASTNVNDPQMKNAKQNDQQNKKPFIEKK